MITDDFSRCDRAALSPDVIIVGAGAVGIVLAVTLARAGRRVTVIEAGPTEPAADYQKANAAACTGAPHRGLVEGRMKALGGTTRLWGGQLVPFSDADLAADTWPGKTAWPVTHAELMVATARVFTLLGMPEEAREPLRVYRDATGQSTQLSDRIAITATAWLPQPDFAELFAHDLKTLPALTVLTAHAVHDMIFAAAGHIEQVVLCGADGTNLRLYGRHVVLACGTFEIVKLLLTLARSHPDCGYADNRHVGRWFIDHLHGQVGHFEAIDGKRVGALLDSIWSRGNKYAVKLHLGDACRTSGAFSNVAGMVLAPMPVREMVAELRALGKRVMSGRAGRAALWTAGQRLRLLAPLIWRYLVHRRAGSVFSRGTALGVEIEQRPCAESFIGLDPENPAQIVLHWSFDGAEIQAVRAFSEGVRDAFAEAGLGELVLDPRVEAGDPGFLLQCSDSYHQMGGARMAASSDDGVVDAQLRVFGTDNLYVAGAATFPSGSFANPTLTAMALAVRLSDYLIKQNL